MEVAPCSLGGEACAQLAICGYSAGDENARGSESLLRSEGLAEQITNDRVLEACDQIECLRVGGGESVFDGGFGWRIWAGK